MTPRGEVTPVHFADAVAAHLSREGRLAPETLDLYTAVIGRFGSFAANGLGLPTIASVDAAAVRHFIDSTRADGSRPSPGHRKVRRTALRSAFKVGRKLGLVEGDPLIDLEIQPFESEAARPLTDEEIERGRPFAAGSRSDFRRSVAWALMEATGRTNEIGLVRVADVELPEVRLPGSSSVDARVATLTDWGVTQIRRRLQRHGPPDTSLIVWRKSPKDVAAASRQAVIEVLRAAGLLAPDRKPRSIVAWRGRRALLEGSPIEAVARMLGARSLDRTAAFIGHDWREPL